MVELGGWGEVERCEEGLDVGFEGGLCAEVAGDGLEGGFAGGVGGL